MTKDTDVDHAKTDAELTKEYDELRMQVHDMKNRILDILREQHRRRCERGEVEVKR